jgi:hypothetical protein
MMIPIGPALIILISLSLHAQSTPPQPQVDEKTTPAKPAPRPNPDAAGNYHVGDGVTAPRLIYSVEPSFSEKARKRKIAGSTKCHLIVETDGHVRDITVIKSAADGLTSKKDREAALELDQQAIKAASQYRFEPA